MKVSKSSSGGGVPRFRGSVDHIHIWGDKTIFIIFKEGGEYSGILRGGQGFLFIFRGVIRKLPKKVQKMVENRAKS